MRDQPEIRASLASHPFLAATWITGPLGNYVAELLSKLRLFLALAQETKRRFCILRT